MDIKSRLREHLNIKKKIFHTITANEPMNFSLLIITTLLRFPINVQSST